MTPTSDEERRRLRERVGERIGDARERVGERLGDAKERLGDARERVGEKLGDAREKLAEVGVKPPPRPQYRPREYVADLLTLANGLCGFFAILTLSVDFRQFAAIPDAYVAAFWIGMGTIADGLDGMVARRWGSTGLGNSLDTISDAITFGLAPALLMLEIQGPAVTTPASVAATGMLLAVMLRLARNREKGFPDSPTFDGLPAPWSGAAVTIGVLLQSEFGYAPMWVPALALTMAALNVSHVKYPRTRGPALTRVVLAILAVGAAVVVGLVIAPDAARTRLLTVAAGMAAAVILIAPWMTPRLTPR